MKMMKKTTFWLLTLASRLSSVASDSYNNEFLVLEGHKVKNDYSLPLPYEYISEDELPEEFSWGNVKGISYLTPSLNQHIPQYCGSCWAHGALSSLADRLKIARGAKGVEVNLSIQYILNCGGDVAGSCHGGSHTGVYEFISKHSGFVPFDTCMPYVACSKESSEGFCKHVDTTCTSTNTCRTCHGFGNPCQQLDYFPNVTIAEYGSYNLFTRNKVHKIKAEIFARGPVAASINALPLENYEGGIVTNGNWLYKLPNHIVSIVGWGKDEKSGIEYWIVRNSWGQYWGEMGFFRIELGKNSLGIEDDVAWATPKTWTEHNYHVDNFVNNVYVDPSVNQEVTKGLLRKRV
jgi:cathepsin X